MPGSTAIAIRSNVLLAGAPEPKGKLDGGEYSRPPEIGPGRWDFSCVDKELRELKAQVQQLLANK
jgi:hypothetical protein